MIKKVIITKDAPEAIGTYSQGIQTEHFIYTSGQIALDPQTGVLQTGEIKGEIRQVLNNLNAVLIEGGSSLNSIVKLTVFVTDLSWFPKLNEIFLEYFPVKPPARSAVEVSALPMGARIEIEAIGMVE